MSQVLKNLETVARELNRLRLEDAVFVGGATIGLLLTDKSAPPPRVTLDVDIVVDIRSRSAFHDLEGRLREAGFKQPLGGPICRWIVRGVALDVMPSEERILGFSNRWYNELLNNSRPFLLAQGLEIRVAAAPYLLATKLEAFKGRGGGDFWVSRDITDIVTLIDGREEIIDEIRTSPLGLRRYLSAEVVRLLARRQFVSSLSAHLPPDAGSQLRVEIIERRLEEIARVSLE